MACVREGADEQQWEQITEALKPPNRMNTSTGLPYGWDEDSELDGFEELLAG